MTRRPGQIRRWDVGRRFGTGLVGLPKTRGRHRILVEVGELEVARSRLITLGGAATVTKSPSRRMVLKGSRRRAGQAGCWAGTKNSMSASASASGWVSGAACPAPGIACNRALGTWSATYRALEVKKGLVSAPCSTSTGAEIAPSTAGSSHLVI